MNKAGAAGEFSDAHTTVGVLRDEVAKFVAEREWERYHDVKNLSMALAVEAAELMEHFQWARSEELDALCDDPARHGEIADEIADIGCFLLSLSNRLKLDLAAAIQRKMSKNRAKYPAEQYRGWYEKPKRGQGG